MTSTRRSSGPWRAVAGIALLALVSGAPARATAFVLYEDPFEGDELTFGATVKSFFFGMHGEVLDQSAMRLWGGVDANPTAMGLLVLRPALELQIGPTWRFSLHYSMDASVSSLEDGGLSSAVGLGRGQTPARFLPLSWTPADHGTFLWRHTLDWVWSRVRMGPVDLTIGRQPITFGRGYIWKSMDLLSTFSPTQIDTEFKPGVDALRIDVALTPESLLTLVAVAGEREDDHDAEATMEGSSFAARAKVGFETWELGFFGGYVREDVVFGADGFVDLGVVSLHAEATVTWVPDDDRSVADEVFARATAGVVWTIPKFKLIGELHYSGLGGADAGDYLAVASSQRAAIGEVYVFGRYYAGLVADWEAHPLLHLSLTTMGNLGDPSVLLAPGLSYSVATNAQVTAGAYLPFGERPYWGAARLSPDSGMAPGMKSEFGTYPYFYYLELKVAL